MAQKEAHSGGEDSFDELSREELLKTHEDLRSHAKLGSDSQLAFSWNESREVVENFNPVPWFIWRMCNYVLGHGDAVNRVSEGLVMGLKNLVIAAASDSVLGAGEPVSDFRKALQILPSDVVAAIGVIHAICRKFRTKPNQRIWRPVLDDALIRALIGYYVGQVHQGFGSGRGMLAGFSGRSGLAVLLADGNERQAQKALETLASGVDIRDVGLRIYRCDPLHVSAIMLSASGCGRNAAFGTIAFSAPELLQLHGNPEQHRWLAAFTIIEYIRSGRAYLIDELHWMTLKFDGVQERQDLEDLAKLTIRRGHGWGWLL